MTAPERHRTLAEVCDLYFPGVTPCALRWMIKRRGYAHSRWGREYRRERLAEHPAEGYETRGQAVAELRGREGG